MKAFSACMLIAVVVAFPVAGCSKAESADAGPEMLKPTYDKPPTPEIVRGNTAFALDLYAKLRTQKGNLFLSPMSISTALGMTYAGARGETAKEMSAVLHLPAEREKANEAMGGLVFDLNALSDAEGARVTVANALWGQKGYPFQDDFIATIKTYYGGGLGEVDFAKSEAARKTINAWVEKQTQERIKDLIPKGVLDKWTRLVLTNTIYFKGDWLFPFKKRSTRDVPFHLSAEEQVDVRMMFQEERFPYAKVEGLQLLEMPYEGRRLSMVVLLPDKVDGLPALEKELTSANLEKWLAARKGTEVYLYLPKFEMTGEFELKPTLEAMGMPLAFDGDKSDLSAISSFERLYISNVIHKAWVLVDEQGTEAAAATAVGVKAAEKVDMQTPPTFRADHPFLFLIRDRKTGSILFMGRVVNPKE